MTEVGQSTPPSTNAPRRAPAKRRSLTGVWPAIQAGVVGLIVTIIITFVLTLLLAWVAELFQIPLPDPFAWMKILYRPLVLAYILLSNLIRSNSAFDSASSLILQELVKDSFEFVFIMSMMVSIFAQQAVAAYFTLNNLYEKTALKWRRGKKRPRGNASQWTRIWATIVAPYKVKMKVGLFLAAAASISIVGVKSFFLHVTTTAFYLGAITMLDILYWTYTVSRTRRLDYRDYRGIPPDILFRDMNRQLFFTVDLPSVIVILIIPAMWFLRWTLGGESSPDIEKAFFTGATSFYLIATCFLIINMLVEWNRILNKQSIVDKARIRRRAPKTKAKKDRQSPQREGESGHPA